MSYINAIIKIPIEIAEDGMYMIQQEFIDVDFDVIDIIMDQPIDRESIRIKFQEFIEKNRDVLFTAKSVYESARMSNTTSTVSSSETEYNTFDDGAETSDIVSHDDSDSHSVSNTSVSNTIISDTADENLTTTNYSATTQNEDNESESIFSNITNSIYNQTESVKTMTEYNDASDDDDEDVDEHILSDYESLDDDADPADYESISSRTNTTASTFFGETVMDILRIFIKPEELKVNTTKEFGKRKTLKNRKRSSNKHTAKRRPIN